MTLPFWKNRKFWRRVGGIVGALLLFALATHPELRLLVPFLDAIGLDALLLLVGAQTISFVSGVLGPAAINAWSRLVPALAATDRITSRGLPGAARRLAGRTLGEYSGHLGQYLAILLGRAWRLACEGPDRPSRPDSLPGTT